MTGSARMRFGAAALSLPALLSVLLAAPAEAQERIVVRSEPGTPVVATEVLVATGPADEPELREGIVHLTARSAVAPLRPALDSLGAHLEVAPHKDAVAFTLTAAPDVWREATRLLAVALFRDPVDPATVVREREEIRAALVGREASPADALAREVDASVYGSDHPWSRPAVGYAATIGSLSPSDVDAFLRRNFTPDRATVAVVGPVEPDEARRHVSGLLNALPLPSSAPPRPTPPASRTDREYESITAWIAAVHPAGRDADVPALRLLAAAAAERLGFAPDRRSVFNVRSEVVRTALGAEVRFQLVVPPREVDLWVGRMREAVDAYAAAPLSPSLFASLLRRWRGERLLELETPEARAAWLARERMLTGLVGLDPAEGIDDLTPERLHRAARALAAPVVVTLGPAAVADD